MRESRELAVDEDEGVAAGEHQFALFDFNGGESGVGGGELEMGQPQQGFGGRQSEVGGRRSERQGTGVISD